MPDQQGWDWPSMLYIARVWLRYSDAEFWKLTARQFLVQYSVHIKLKGLSSPYEKQETFGYIDQIPGW